MNTVMQTGKDKTLLSVEKGQITLLVGKDLEDGKLGPFMDVVNELLTGVDKDGKPFYGHFSFSRGTMEATLSYSREGPAVADLTYKRKL